MDSFAFGQVQIASNSKQSGYIPVTSYTSVGGATRHTVIVHVCLCICLSALVLKVGKESAGGKCMQYRHDTLIDGLRFFN